MSGALTIWARQRLADIKERLREVSRRQVRKSSSWPSPTPT